MTEPKADGIEPGIVPVQPRPQAWSKTPTGWSKVVDTPPPVVVSVTEEELRAFEKAHHGELRGVSGPARLDRIVATRETVVDGTTQESKPCSE